MKSVILFVCVFIVLYFLFDITDNLNKLLVVLFTVLLCLFFEIRYALLKMYEELLDKNSDLEDELYKLKNKICELETTKQDKEKEPWIY